MFPSVYRERLLTRKKKPVVHKTNWQTQAFGKTHRQIQRGELFSFLKKKRKQVLIQQKKKISSIFFYFGLKDNFFFSPPYTSKKSLSTITKIPSEEQKKSCLLANTYANEPVGHPPRNNFSLFYSLLKTFLANKKKKKILKCGGNLNDQI